VSYLKDVVSVIEVHELDGKLLRQIPLPAVGDGSISGDEEDDTAYIHFTSFTHPTEILETSIKKGDQRTGVKLSGPVDPSRFTVEQVSFTSKDKTRVPMFIVRPKDLKKDGSAPLYLTGYGGFQISITPSFDASLYPWLERGGVYAVPNLRGGGEFGEDWHPAGMLHHKQHA